MNTKHSGWGMPVKRAPDALSGARIRAWFQGTGRDASTLQATFPGAGEQHPKTPLKLHDGTLEALKWLALLLMLGDHVNKYLLDWEYPWLFDAGRVVMPVFAFVMGYNLARPTLGREGFQRIMRRLALVAVISTPVFLALGKLAMGWYPLNVLFMLLVAVITIDQIQRGQPVNFLVAASVALVGGALVEYWWPGVLLVVCAWHYFRTTSLLALLGAGLSLGCLTPFNGNAWAFVAVPLVALAHLVRVPTPRLRWAFYAFYPIHLVLLLVLQRTALWAG